MSMHPARQAYVENADDEVGTNHFPVPVPVYIECAEMLLSVADARCLQRETSTAYADA